jgi:tetratricopeptide (TPR) repeat protein
MGREENMIGRGLAFLSFLAYLATTSPSVYLGDSGELTAAAFCLGVPHASGYPVHALLGKVFCLIPIGNVGFRMNLMSAVFGVLAVWVVYSLIYRMTGSKAGAFAGAGTLAFIRMFWWQTVAAEVYTLHVFFVAVMVWLLWKWDESREFHFLVVFALVTGLSFGNHMQTVMLGPAVFYLILSGEWRALLKWKRFWVLSIFFVLALLVYVYLPVRTWADAAIHWGDPDSWDRFWTHVSGRAHRRGYIFNLSLLGYVDRAKESLWLIWKQFGVMVLVGMWGWWKVRSWRWRVFFVMVVVFDYVYTIGLNTVSLEITPFNLATCIIMAVLIGVGVAEGVKGCERHAAGVVNVVKGACVAIPVLFLILNYRPSDQSRNYTAHEHALNIFRTARERSLLLVSGDNYLFPLVYGRIVERMREDVALYDRLNILFKFPEMDRGVPVRSLGWEERLNLVEQQVIKQKGSREAFYGVFGPYAISLPEEYALIPEGVLYHVAKEPWDSRRAGDIWKFYATESFYDVFERDFMSREVCAYFFFSLGKHLVLAGHPSSGLKKLKAAAEIGYNDDLIHSDMAVFLTDHGFFAEARIALEKALTYHEDLSGVYNNWGYYYHRIGDHEGSVLFFRKAVELRPDRHGFYNNLGFALFEAGRPEESREALMKSLGIYENQPEIRRFLETSLSKHPTVQ